MLKVLRTHHRARHHDEVLVLAVTQHAHLDLLLGLHRAHVLDHRAVRIRRCPAMRLAVERDDDVALEQARLRGRAARAHAQHARAFLAARRIDLHSEHRAPRTTLVDPDEVLPIALCASCVDSSATFCAALSSSARALSSSARVFASSASSLAASASIFAGLGRSACAMRSSLPAARLCRLRGSHSAEAQQPDQHQILHERLRTLKNWRSPFRRSAPVCTNRSVRRACAPGARHPPCRRAAARN